MSDSEQYQDIVNIVEIENKYLNKEKLETRKYQLRIAKDCVGKNSLIVLPTGLGKTIIAVLVVAFNLEKYPIGSKIIIMAPTRPLINQHYETFRSFLSLPEKKYCILTGKNLPKERPQEFQTHQILFFTPHTLRNDLAMKKYSLENTCLIIFDEAHHATGDYPYALIADEYIDQNPDGIILGMTASPGASKEKIIQLCHNLHIPPTNIHLRARKDTDVKGYLKPLDIYKIGVNLTSLMDDTCKAIKILLEERLQHLAELDFIKVKAKALHKKVIRKDLLKLNNELISLVHGDGNKTGVYSSLSINAQALILFHMIELIEQQGLDVLLIYLEKLQKDAKKKNSSKATRVLASDYRIRQIHLELMKNKELNSPVLVHPKLKILRQIIIDELNKNHDSRILVFVKLRASVRNIVENLKENKLIKPIRFVGQATKSKEDKGLNQKQQIELLDLFKKGKYNVLVSTNVAEEGLDIAECDLVIFYDVVASEIRLIQRKGRTARHRKGKVIILYCRNTNDEVYLNIALNKLNKMQRNLQKPSLLKENEKKIKNKTQSNLGDFLSKKDKAKKEKAHLDIKVHCKLDMKFGLRKKLSENRLPFIVVDSQIDIELFDKIAIQIYDPRDFSENSIIGKNQILQESHSLGVNIFDFIDFSENYESEKRLLKTKFRNLGNTYNLQVINIDTPEELFFIIKNIYQHNIQEEKKL